MATTDRFIIQSQNGLHLMRQWYISSTHALPEYPAPLSSLCDTTSRFASTLVFGACLGKVIFVYSLYILTGITRQVVFECKQYS